MMGKLLLFLILIFSSTLLFANNATNYAGNVVENTSTGTVAWSNPNLAAGPIDATYAVSGNLDNTISRYLYATNYGFNIPINSTIDGIIVSVTRKVNNAGNLSRDNNLRLITNGVINITDRATTTPYTVADVTEAHGTSTDNWGVTLTPQIVNSARFGVAYSAYKIAAGGPVNISVDAILINIYYTEITGRRRVVGRFLE